jgi:hypothetical protein
VATERDIYTIDQAAKKGQCEADTAAILIGAENPKTHSVLENEKRRKVEQQLKQKTSSKYTTFSLYF